MHDKWDALRVQHKKETYDKMMLYFRKDGGTEGVTRADVQAHAAELGLTGTQYVMSLIYQDLKKRSQG